MKNRTIPRLLSIVVALGLVAIVVSRVHAQANTNVKIEALAIEGTSLTITGANFGSAPAVFIGGDALVVSHNSNSEYVAATPQLARGMHIVKVVRDGNQGGSAESTLQIR